MKFLIVCMLALVVSCLAGKLRKTDSAPVNEFHLDDFHPDEFGASDAWANDEWGDEDWPNEPYQKPLTKPLTKPFKGWDEPIVVEKKVPIYVPVPVEHVRTIVKHHPVYIKENSPSIFIRKITHYKHH